MFGLTAYSQTPYSALAGNLFSASVTLSADSALTSFANVVKPSVSALVASDSSLTAIGERIGVATALISSDSTVASNGVRYAFGAALVASESGASAYGIRYAFGGATIVGESDVSAITYRYTFPSATLTATSGFNDVYSNVIFRESVGISSDSDFSARVVYRALGRSTLEANSNFVANVREKWENEAIATEIWVNVPSTNEIWTVVPATSETWTPTH